MSSAHLPSQVPVPSDYERGVQKGIDLAIAIVMRSTCRDEALAALQELAE